MQLTLKKLLLLSFISFPGSKTLTSCLWGWILVSEMILRRNGNWRSISNVGSDICLLGSCCLRMGWTPVSNVTITSYSREHLSQTVVLFTYLCVCFLCLPQFAPEGVMCNLFFLKIFGDTKWCKSLQGCCSLSPEPCQWSLQGIPTPGCVQTTVHIQE